MLARSSAPARNNYVAIDANTLSYTGGLHLNANGAGGTDPNRGGVFLGPKGSTTYTAPTDITQNITIDLFNPLRAAMTVSGSGTLEINARGLRKQAVFSAYPMTFSGGAVDVFAVGEDVIVNFSMTGDRVGNNSLVFSGGAVRLFADNDNGTAGHVSIFADVLPQPASTVSLNANATGTTGDGGIAEILVYDGDVHLGSGSGSFRLSATSSATNGGAGQIFVNGFQSTSNVKLHSSYVVGSLALTPLGTNGEGGEFTVIAGAFTNDTGGVANIEAKGKGTGGGGKVDLSTSNSIDLSTLKIATTGGDSGEGGEVIVTNPTGDNGGVIDVLEAIKIDAGPNYQGQICLGPCDFYGKITLRNGVTCQKWATAQQVWPKEYFVCTPTHEQPSALDLVQSDLAQTATFDSLRLEFSSEAVSLFTFADGADYNSFFNDVLPAEAGGFTFRKPQGAHIYSTAWQKGSIGDPNLIVTPYNTNQLKEVSAHELGHVAHIAFNQEAFTVAYDKAVLRDLEDLDKVYVAGVPVADRLPCQSTPGSSATPPFLAVQDYRYENGMGGYENVCVTVAGQGLVLNPARWMGTFSNRIVLRTIEPGLHVGGLPPLPPLWAELYAQAFAYRAVGNLGARPMHDKVFDNGASNYFVCIKAWADAALSGQANGPTVPPTTQSGACNVYP